MSDHIPFEIQLEIIKRVSDVKSLVRFMSVSKPWKSFIESSEFITSYGVRHTQQQHRLVLRYYEHGDPRPQNYLSFIDDNNDIIMTHQQQQQPPAPFLMNQISLAYAIGSSCGLWGLSGLRRAKKKLFVIWNPSIRKSIGVVVPTLDRSVTCFGFGVCPVTYDPTIVKMSYLETISYKCHKWQVEVFTLSSKTWKMLPSSKLPRESISIISYTQPVIDMFIFWLTLDALDGKRGVLSFHLATHEFKEVTLPESIAHRPRAPSISKLRDSLVVSGYFYGATDWVYGVWGMGVEGGVMKAFTKLFNINIPDSFFLITLLGFRMSGEPIIETANDQEAFSKIQVYEPSSEQIIDLGLNGGVCSSFFICPYEETLLLIDHSDAAIISDD